MPEGSSGRVVGRYALFDVLATGGMATVHFGRLLGPVGFARTVAIKRLHPQFARDPEFVSMFLDEARMCARIRHPNVVPTLDVVATKGELFLVMEYVQGESLALLIRSAQQRGERIPWKVAVSILAGTLHGLHAAHEAKDERGLMLDLVHRDVSPQNILVGADGMARVVDFGIAKATGRLHVTRENAVKGKLGYMAPEQMAAESVTRQADLYSAAVVLWEALATKRLFDGESEAIVLSKVLAGEIKPPSTFNPDIPKELDEIVLKALSRSISGRFKTAKELAGALERLGPAALGEVGEWVEKTAGPSLEKRSSRVSEVENGSQGLTPAGQTDPPPPPTPTRESPSRESGAVHYIPAAGQLEASQRTPSAAEILLTPGTKRGPWVAAAVVGTVALAIVGGWVIASRGGPADVAASTSTARTPDDAATAQSETADAVPAPSPELPSAPIKASSEATASESASSEALASSVSSVAQTSSGRPALWGTVPKWTPPTATASSTGKKSPFDLGGRR